MLSAENLASIESEGRRLALAVRQDPGRPVPQYPDWTLADLASHTASIHGRTVLVCLARPVERISAPRLPEGMDPIAWYEEPLEVLLLEPRAAGPAPRGRAFGATGRRFRLVSELPLSLVTGAARRASLLGGCPALPLCLLLLPPGKLLQRLHLLLELVTGLSALTSLDGLVLVLELIEFELEDIGQVIRSRTAPAPAASLLSLTDLYLVTLLGLLEIPKCFQFR